MRRASGAVILLADDLSGAAEVAGLIWGAGGEVEVQIGGEATAGAGSLVIDTETRGLPPAEAACAVREVCAGLARRGLRLDFKKVDSVVRGPVRAEVEAAMEALGLRRCILLPANPSRGRTLEGGVYRVHGVPLHETEFAADPAHPARTASAVELLGPGVQPVVVAGPRDALPEEGIILADARSAADVAAWAERTEPAALSAGAADFLQALLARRGMVPRRASEPMPAGRRLLVSGSASAMSRAAIEQAEGSGVPVVRLPTTAAPGSPEVRRGAERVAKALSSADRVILCIAGPHSAEPDAPRRLEQALAEAAAAALASAPVGRLLLEGGSTAAATLARLGLRRLRVAGQPAPGIVRLQAIGAEAPEIVTKPGSYGWAWAFG
ncbi:MAG: hypothetical protein NT029_16670 [Armatimonadetes bacterium]|nr:hypothetical protein [Armatimonadota bacterium]